MKPHHSDQLRYIAQRIDDERGKNVLVYVMDLMKIVRSLVGMELESKSE